MDWREFWIEHNGERRDALTFGAGFLPELSRIANSYAMHATWFLEWGSGVSTLLLARLAAARGGRLITIDHSAAYAQSVMKRIHPDAPVQSVIADLTGPKDLVGTDVPNYGTFPLTLGHTFDFVLIDGRRRLECALTAFVASSPSTVVVLHDYLRVRYRPMSVLFETLETGPQFLVMRARPELLHGTAAQRAHLLDEYQRSGKIP